MYKLGGSSSDVLKGEGPSKESPDDPARSAFVTVEGSQFIFKAGIHGYEKYHLPAEKATVEYLVFLSES